MRLKLLGHALWTALAVLLVVGAAEARPRGGRGGGLLDPQAIEQLAARLGLEPAVVDRLKAQLGPAHARHLALKAELREARHKVKGLLDTDQPDRAAVRAALLEVGRLRTALDVVKTEALLDVRAALTPAQRAQLRSMREAFRERRHQRGRPGPPPPPVEDEGAQ